MIRTVAVAFTPAPAAQNPNLRSTGDAGAATTYYRSMVVTFASVRRWNPGLVLVLVSDVTPPDPFAGQLAALGVRLLDTMFDHRPPVGFWPTFNASLFTLDAMAALSRHGNASDRFLLIDPDVLCVGDLTPAFDSFSGKTFLVYPTGIPEHEESQGISAIDVVPMHHELDTELLDPPIHYGGEFYGFTPVGAAPVLARAEDAWQLSLRGWAEAKPHFVTEEHLLNYALRRAPMADGQSFIRRIWTAPVYRTVRGDEHTLLLWHLPSEKDRAFSTLSGAALDPHSWFWTSDCRMFIRKAGAINGMPRRRLRRWAYDVAGKFVRRAQRFARRFRLRPPIRSHVV